MGEPCEMPRPLSRASVVRRSAALVVGFFDRAFQPHLDQMQHAPINDPARNRFHQFGMWLMLPKEAATDYPSPRFPCFGNGYPRASPV